MKYISIVLLFLLVNVVCLLAQDTNIILSKVDHNQMYETIRFNGELTVITNGRKNTKTFKTIAKGTKNYFNEFTNPEDAGTKYLKKDGALFLYNPEIEEVVPIVGHMLKQSMMGSDMSYEDMVNNDNLSILYTAVILEETEFNGRNVWVLELTARDKSTSYQKRKLWVDKENYYPLKSEMYAVSGKLLKVQTIEEVIQINGKNFPVKRVTKDLVRKNSETTITFKDIVMNITIEPHIFSLSNLK